MSSKREALTALAALVAAAIPDAQFERNLTKPPRLAGGGNITMFDGDPGEPEITLSPLAYTYRHRVRFEIIPPAGVEADVFIQPIGPAIEADRYLGGKADWLEAEAPLIDADDILGAETLETVPLDIIVTYTTSSPLG